MKKKYKKIHWIDGSGWVNNMCIATIDNDHKKYSLDIFRHKNVGYYKTARLAKIAANQYYGDWLTGLLSK